MGDEELHKTYMYLRYVEKLLPKNKVDTIDLEGSLKLTFYNLKQTFQGSVSLSKTDETEGLVKPQGSGIPIAILPEQRYLEEVIKKSMICMQDNSQKLIICWLKISWTL